MSDKMLVEANSVPPPRVLVQLDALALSASRHLTGEALAKQVREVSKMFDRVEIKRFGFNR